MLLTDQVSSRSVIGRERVVTGSALMYVPENELEDVLKEAADMQGEVEITVLKKVTKDKTRIKKKKKKKRKKKSNTSLCIDVTLACLCVAVIIAVVLIIVFLDDIREIQSDTSNSSNTK